MRWPRQSSGSSRRAWTSARYSWSARRSGPRGGCSTARSRSAAAPCWAPHRRAICRTIASSTRSVSSRRRARPWTTTSRSRASGCRSVPICCSPPPISTASFSTWKSVRTAGFRCHPAATPHWPARRCLSICRRAISSSARPTTGARCAPRIPRAIWPPICIRLRDTVNRPPIWPGMDRPWCARTATCSPRASGSPTIHS